MPYTLKTQQISVKDPDSGEYIGVDVLAEQNKESLIAEIQSEGDLQVERVDQKSAEILAAGDAQVTRINQTGTNVQTLVNQEEARAQQIVSDAQTSLNTLEAQKNTIAETVASMAELGTDTTLTTSGMAADAKATGDEFSNVKNAFTVLGEDYELALGTWENGGFVSWDKRIANRYAIDVKKDDIITVKSQTLRWNLGVYPPGSQSAIQNTGWANPDDNTHTVVSQYDGRLFLIFAKTSGDTMTLSDYDATVHIYNTFSGHLTSGIVSAKAETDSVNKNLNDITNYQEFTIFDEPISLTTFADIPVNFPAGTYDFYASSFISSDTDDTKCRMVLRSSGGTDIYTWDNNRNVEINRVITSNQDVAILRIYAGTTYNNSLNDTLTVDSMVFYLRTGLSDRLSNIESNLQSEENKTRPLTERVTGILNLVKGKYMSHIGVSQYSNIIIPSQSMADLERAKRLGFNVVELNVRKTADDDSEYVCLHGVGGNFGPQFEDVNGNSVENVAVSSLTLAEIKNTIRYKTKYARYKTAPFTLQEMLYECKKLGIVPLIEHQSAYTDEISIIESILGKSGYMLATYTYDRSTVGSNAPMFSWLTITNASQLVEKCNASGGAYIAGINVTDSAFSSFTENDWKSLVSAVHDAGYAVSFAYGSDALKQKLMRCGFDIINTSNNVPEIETGNVLNIPDTVTFDGFSTSGSISGGVLSLSNGQSITPTTLPDTVFLGAGSLHIVFDGEISVTMGSHLSTTIQSDGSQQSWLSVYYEEERPTFEITSVGNTTVTMLSFKSSEV